MSSVTADTMVSAPYMAVLAAAATRHVGLEPAPKSTTEISAMELNGSFRPYFGFLRSSDVPLRVRG
jgi:hypothetical protein